MGIENDLVFVGRSKMTCFVRGSTDMFFVWVVKFDLISVLRIEIYLILVSETALTSFLCGWSQLAWLLCRPSKMT